MKLLHWMRPAVRVCVVLGMLASPVRAIEYRQLTFLDSGSDNGISTPAWSPDGTRIAYTSWWVDESHWSYLFGSVGIVQVSDGSAIPFPGQDPACSLAMDGLSSHPSWSPEGDRLVYGCGSGLAIGSVAESLATGIVGVDGRHPAWSPDASQIAYSGSGGIWTVPAGGGASSQITSGPDLDPAWSRDGQWIAFASRRNGPWDIWIVPSTGGEVRSITDDAAADHGPTWSPDGEFIAFASDRSGNYDVWVVRLANGKLSQVTVDPAPDGDPDWAPDGSQIAFSSVRSGYSNIWIASDLRTVSAVSIVWGALKQLYR